MAKGSPVPLQEAEVHIVLGSLPATLLLALQQDHDPKRDPDDPGQNPGQDLNLGLGPEGVLVVTTPGRELVPALIVGPEAGPTAGIIGGGAAVIATLLCPIGDDMLEIE